MNSTERDLYNAKKKKKNETKTNKKQNTKRNKKPSINKIKCAMDSYEYFLNLNSIAAARSLPINVLWSIKSNFCFLVTCVLSCSTFKSSFLFTLPVVFDSTILTTCQAAYLERNVASINSTIFCKASFPLHFLLIGWQANFAAARAIYIGVK